MQPSRHAPSFALIVVGLSALAAGGCDDRCKDGDPSARCQRPEPRPSSSSAGSGSSAAPRCRDNLWNANAGAPMQLSFDPPRPVDAGPVARMTLGDFDADGALDLALVAGTRVEFLPGDGQGGFGERVLVHERPEPGASGLHAADLDGDGADDLLVAGRARLDGSTSTGALSIVFGGDDFPGEPLELRARVDFIDAGEVVAADFDGDARLDVAGCARAAGFCAAAFNDGERAFTDAAYLTEGPDSSTGLIAADFDGDGPSELAVVSAFNSFGWRFFRADEGRAWTSEAADGNLLQAAAAHFPRARDLDDDGRIDLVVNSQRDLVWVAWNDGGGDYYYSGYCTRLELITETSPSQPFGVGVADFDGDGALDLVVADAAYHALAFLGGRSGVQQFKLPRVLPLAARGPTDLAVGDLDGDDLPDVLVAHADPAGISVLLNAR